MRMRSMSTHSKEILFRITVRLSEAVQSRSERSEQISEALALSGIGRIFEVDIDTVETVVLDELEGTVDEGCPLASIGDKVEVTSLGVCPTTNGEGDLEVTVLEFEEVQLLQATIEVVPCVIP